MHERGQFILLDDRQHGGLQQEDGSRGIFSGGGRTRRGSKAGENGDLVQSANVKKGRGDGAAGKGVIWHLRFISTLLHGNSESTGQSADC
jgi:hypothetical protein